MAFSMGFSSTKRRVLIAALFIFPLLCGNIFLLYDVSSWTTPSSLPSSSSSASLMDLAWLVPPDEARDGISTIITKNDAPNMTTNNDTYDEVIVCPEINKNVDTSGTFAIVILSSFSAVSNSPLPSIETINSIVSNVSPFSIPIFITIDGLEESYYQNDNIDENLFPKMEQMEEYSVKLLQKYLLTPKMHILPTLKHVGVTASIMKVLNLVQCYYKDVETIYYYLQSNQERENENENENELHQSNITANVMATLEGYMTNKKLITIQPYDKFASSKHAMTFQLTNTNNDSSTIKKRRDPYGVIPINTAIIISSSWIPSHPSSNMIETVINSTKFIIGLPTFVPIIITIDAIPRAWYDINNNHKNNNNNNNATDDALHKISNLESYTTTLFQKYLLPSPLSSHRKIHILPSLQHLHIAGSVMKGLLLLEKHYPSIDYLYYLQHDFSFIQKIDHVALIDLSSKYYPGKVNYIRFQYYEKEFKKLFKCGNETKIIHHMSKLDYKIAVHSITLYPSPQYSDNNHFVRLSWYKDMIGSIGMKYLRRPPEFYLLNKIEELCGKNVFSGVYFYSTVVLKHLDGRRTVNY